MNRKELKDQIEACRTAGEQADPDLIQYAIDAINDLVKEIEQAMKQPVVSVSVPKEIHERIKNV